MPEVYRELMRLIPYKRIGEPNDIGHAAVWLASDDSDYIHGASILVDDGMTLYPGFETDGLGGFASGTVSGIRTRRYHALPLSATIPSTGRMALVVYEFEDATNWCRRFLSRAVQMSRL